MSRGELVNIEPQELKFPFELKKQISSSLQLSNNTHNYVAFKVKTTNRKKYCVRPNTGVVLPLSTCDVVVTMQPQREAPPDLQCTDKFLLQSVTATPGATPKDITPQMFNKESRNLIDECKLRVVYVAPPQPPSPVSQGSEEGLSEENGTHHTSDFTARSRGSVELQDISSEVSAFISKLMEEAVQQANKIRQELELLRSEASKRRGGVQFLYVVIIALIGIFLGYMLRT